jgi:hypothetical protein
MENYNIIVSVTHPPYPTEAKSSPSVNSPLPEHVDIAFRYATEYGGSCVGDIWFNWIVRDQQGIVLDHREMLFAVSREHDCCFAVRMKERRGQYENLVWSCGPDAGEIITLEDSGGGEWRFRAGSKVPMADAIALAKRFVAEGYIGDDLEWEMRPRPA